MLIFRFSFGLEIIIELTKNNVCTTLAWQIWRLMDCNTWPPDYLGNCKKSIEVLLFVSLKLKATWDWTINEFICFQSLKTFSFSTYIYLFFLRHTASTRILLTGLVFLQCGLYALIKKIFLLGWINVWKCQNIWKIYSKYFLNISNWCVLCKA